MFGNKGLIFTVLLLGCTTQATNTPNISPIFSPSLAIDTTLLNSTKTTLEIADQAINKREIRETNNKNKILSLKQLVSQEERLILTLEESLTVKDSILINYQENTELLEDEISTIEKELNKVVHKCTTQCYPTIVKLKQNNKRLLTYIDSLQNRVFYLDSLVLTNRKLSKKITQYEIKRRH